MPKVIIIGAGVSGLSCAYDLISRGYEVEIYERSGTFGGQAKSLKTNKCFVPYAWRIWTNYYYNFLDITGNIPFSNGKTVRDNIVHIPKYSHELQTSEGRQLSGGNVLDPNNFQNRSDYYKLWNKLINMFLLSEKRLRENDITFYDYIDPKDKATEDFTMEFVGPIIGMEAKKATLFCITKGWEVTYMSRSIHTGLFKSGEVYVTNGPYSEVLFDPWAKYLVEQGVTIHTNTTVASLNYDTETKKITSIDTNTKKNIIADDFVICMDQSSINKLLRNNKELMDIKMLKNSTELMKYGNEMYFGMVLYFSEKFDPPLGTGCAQDQPWKVVIENFAASWEKKYTDSCNSAEIIQASCLDLYPGLNGKMLHECSVEEAIQETIRELQQSKLMKDLKTVSGKSVWDVFNGYDVWPEWVNGKDGKITNKDNFYKFSINKNCWDLMPKTKTPIKNLFFGSVITKTEVPMVSMEIACSNGRHAASAICEKYDVKPPHVYKHPGFLPNLLSPYRGMDWLLFSMGIRSNMLVVFILMNILFIILLILIIRGIYRRFKR
jgi:hypothetical protein